MSAICGGVVNQTTYDSDPWAYMMCWIMPDKEYSWWVEEKDEKLKAILFKTFAYSAI